MTTSGRQLTTGGVQILYTVKFVLHDTDTLQPSVVYSTFTTQLTSLIASGNFTVLLQKSGLPLFASASSTVDSLVISNFTVLAVNPLAPTAQLTSAPKESTEILTSGAIIGIAVAGAVVLLAAMFCVYRLCLRRSPHYKTVMVVPSELNIQDAPDRYETYVDLERLKSPQVSVSVEIILLMFKLLWLCFFCVDFNYLESLERLVCYFSYSVLDVTN